MAKDLKKLSRKELEIDEEKINDNTFKLSALIRIADALEGVEKHLKKLTTQNNAKRNNNKRVE